MPDELVTTEHPHSGLVQRLNPQVLSKANPEVVDLLQARADVQRVESLKEIFRKSVTEQWPDGRLESEVTAGLRQIWPHGDPTEAAQFLADEYRQLGEGIHLVSTETGRVTLVLTEADIHQPAPVPREGGGMATPLPIIRPDLSAALVTWNYTNAREAQVLEVLAARGHQTELLRELGDPRLLVASRAGRKHIVESLAQIPPKALLESAGGTSAAFLKFFQLVDEPLTEVPAGHAHLKGATSAKSTMGIQDMLTTNLSYNRPRVLQGAVTQGWIRDMAKAVSQFAYAPTAEEAELDDIVSLPAQFWILPPQLTRPFMHIDRKITVLPVDDAHPMGLAGSAGYIYVPSQFQAKSREFFSRWETVANLEFQIWLRLDALRPLTITGQAHEAQVV